MSPVQSYQIKGYEQGFEKDQARIGQEAAQQWVWPYAYDHDDLLKMYAQPGFDPSTLHYCFLGNQMVGYLASTVTPAGERGAASAALDFPRMLPGHEAAAGVLLERALETLRRKGAARVTGRVTTMCPGDVRLAEAAGFSISEWGYKVYYSYEMSWGMLDFPGNAAIEINPDGDLGECAALAALWYKRSVEWCLAHLKEWHGLGVITHSGVRKLGKLTAACLAAPNLIRPPTAAIYYIFTPGESDLRALLARVVGNCIACGSLNVIADLVNEHRQYEPVYQELGFQKVAEWARCEKLLE